MVTSCYCYIVSILALLTHIPYYSVEVDKADYSILTHCRSLNSNATYVFISCSPSPTDGGVWQSCTDHGNWPFIAAELMFLSLSCFSLKRSGGGGGAYSTAVSLRCARSVSSSTSSVFTPSLCLVLLFIVTPASSHFNVQ